MSISRHHLGQWFIGADDNIAASDWIDAKIVAVVAGAAEVYLCGYESGLPL